MSPRAILFDLDGTVLTYEGPPPGPGRTALDRAMLELHAFGQASDGIRLAGGTDRALARAMLARARATADDAAISRVLESYVGHLASVLRTRRYRPIGPVSQTVRAIEARGAVVGVATGNTRQGAHLKLSSAGLHETFDMDRGAFGCDAEPRAEIVRLAAARCGAAHAGSDVVVVGDTKHDVLAARSIGARVIGLAIDAAASRELREAGADAIVEDCGEALIAALFETA